MNLTEFRKDKSHKHGYGYTCIKCARKFQQSNYIAKYGESSKKRSITNRNKNKKLLLEYKSSVHCSQCGEDEPICLDFHHIDPSTKEFAIASGMSRSWEKITKEIEKCIRSANGIYHAARICGWIGRC